MMNENILKGKWTQVKGHVKSTWGKLTDDDIEKTNGDITKIAGLVQQHYGEAQDKIQEGLSKFVSGIADKIQANAADSSKAAPTPTVAPAVTPVPKLN
jgi:uncharacterized protein YjbJ (UPF0337 family)